jgi:thiol-disulfide isomerase/thioredoxin
MNAVKPMFAAILLVAGFVFHVGESAAQELKPFVKGSMKSLFDARQGKPFIVGFWSLSCAHCRDELVLLGELTRKYPKMEVVLVSTDTPEEGEAVVATLKQASLQRAEAWVFADQFADRLHFEVDRKWRGELPRTYLYDAAHNATAFSGKLDPQQLEQWVRAHPAVN